MAAANINRFIVCLHKAFDALAADVSMAQVEDMAVRIHSAMESPQRRYHVSDHALYMCDGMTGRQTLAAVFHDSVYYQLDKGFPARLHALLTPVVSQQGQDLLLLKPGADDHALQLCLDLFGFEGGQLLPLFRGMNEFLSAVAAVRLLQPFLALSDLLAVVACIEATVPFRGPGPDGRDCTELLAQRVRAQAQQRLGLAPGEPLDDYVLGVMRNAVAIANRDVGGFSEPDPGKFVSVTWLLIEESNAPLAAVGVYTLQDYRVALTRMQHFLDGLEATRVFQRYAGVPEPDTFGSMARAAGANIGFASAFLRLKIASISIIEALALHTGGNAPVSMFLGDIQTDREQTERAENYLPPGPDATGLDAQMLHVLEVGRPQDARNDLTVSPLTAYVYRCLGPEGCAQALAQAKRMVAGEVSPLQFLAHLHPAMLGSIIEACARIAVSRRAQLLDLRAQLCPPG
jgi:hypothetical protein